MISAIFIDRPRLAVVIAIVVTIAGLLAMTRLPVAQFPDIVPLQVSVTANYPGASAAAVEASVAEPIEQQVVGADKMIYMSSTSGDDGSYSLTVSFVLGSGPDIDTVEVLNRVQTALAQLLSEVEQEGLTIQKKSSAILQFINLYSENGKQDPLFITNYAIINALDVLSRTPGVGLASIFNPFNCSMRIWFDTQRFDNLQLTPANIISAIQAQNVVAPIGQIGLPPIGKDQQFQMNVQTQGRLTTPEQFGNIVLRANPDGSLLRVRDVARVDLGAEKQNIESSLNGEPSVGIAIYLSPGANAVQTADLVRANMKRLSQRFPPGLKYMVNYDTSTFVLDTVHDVPVTLFIAFALVDHRRLPIRARRAGGSEAHRNVQHYARAHRRRQPGPAAHSRLLDRHRQQSVDLSRHRPREGAGAGPHHERRVQRAAGDVGRHLHQQLQPLWAGMAGQYRGRARPPPRSLLAVADLHSQQLRRRRAVAIDCQRAGHRRAAGHQPLQQLPRDPD